MNQKEITKTVMMISNCKKPFGLQGFHKNFLALQGLNTGVSVKEKNEIQ